MANQVERATAIDAVARAYENALVTAREAAVAALKEAGIKTITLSDQKALVALWVEAGAKPATARKRLSRVLRDLEAAGVKITRDARGGARKKADKGEADKAAKGEAADKAADAPAKAEADKAAKGEARTAQTVQMAAPQASVDALAAAIAARPNSDARASARLALEDVAAFLNLDI